MDLQSIKDKIAAIPDFPTPGILFRDVFPVLMEPKMVDTIIEEIVTRMKPLGQVDVIAGKEYALVCVINVIFRFI